MGLAGRLVTEGLQLMGELPDLCVGPRELVSVQEVIREARLSKSELQALLSPNVSQALVRYMAEFLTPIQNLAVAQPGKLVAKESVRDRLDQWVKDANDACLGVSTNRKVDVPRIQDMEFEPNGIVRFPVVCGKLRTFAVPMIELSDHTTRVWAAPEWRPATTE
ncbi:hypothetical protein GNI_110880 [Gregarina niphandrodes]|uniref:Uncharacterized protein n=1 Tax=Gregarina niphandrodes TaxID=110365 RepID=A0A023B3K8_GRENI|nr:hypothetical protein GNI_110880 [Gregarina niphandrodes]EZG55578.1 hypothetical protein GNI_110880 [Gregarina niphandrodes]|eukprot:XP_011131491.1 hypothetical protein GNI_110880 [Gregarina niphandrodes]